MVISWLEFVIGRAVRGRLFYASPFISDNGRRYFLKEGFKLKLNKKIAICGTELELCLNFKDQELHEKV